MDTQRHRTFTTTRAFAGVSAKMDGLADKDLKDDNTTTQPEDLTCCCVMCSPEMTAGDAAAFLRVNVDECSRTKRGELVVAEQASPSGDRKNNEDVSSARTLRQSPLSREQSRQKAKASRAKRKLEATLSGTLLTCDLCPYKTCYSGVMSRHIQAHAHYQLCSCDFCDFKCHGVELIDKHVIENHLKEIGGQSKKGKKKNANAQKPSEALPSNPLVNVEPSLDLLGRRHRYKLNKSTDATSDLFLSTSARKKPNLVTHKRKALANINSHVDSAKGLTLARLSNVLAKKLNAPFTGMHQEDVKIQTPVALAHDASSKESISADLPRNSSNQVGGDCADVTPEEQSGTLVEAEHDELSRESSLHHLPIESATQSLRSRTDSESNSNKSSNPQSTSSQLTPPKKRKISDDRSELSDLLMKAPWNSSKVTSSEPSEDVVAAELREYILLKKQVAGNEQAETSGESLVIMKNNTSTQPCAQSSPSAQKIIPKVKSHSKVPTSNQNLLTCNECHFTTIKPQQLTQHMKTHTKVEPYVCDFCDFKACSFPSLRKHMVKHTPSVVTNQKEITEGFKKRKSSKTGSGKS